MAHGGTSSAECSLRIDPSAYAVGGTLIATLVNVRHGSLAVAWAQQLAAIGLRGAVGIASLLAKDELAALTRAGTGVFCTTSTAMQINSQAGRWAEVASLLRSGLSVLLSDVDVGWARDPLPYLNEVLAAHPHAALLISSNIDDGNFSTMPLPSRLRASGLELEDPQPYRMDESRGALNIGILFFHSRARRFFVRMLDQWVSALSHRRGDGRLELEAFDQGRVNHLLHQAFGPHPVDPRLISMASSSVGDDGLYPPIGVGVLPALQFSTAAVHFVWRKVSVHDETLPPPFAIHATCALGRAVVRKKWVLHEAGLWPTSLYSANESKSHDQFLKLELPAPAVTGRERITAQLRQVGAALHVARALNRSLILPQLHCGEEAHASPCRAAIHRRTTRALPLPAICPVHYWVEPVLAAQMSVNGGVPVYPPTFDEAMVKSFCILDGNTTLTVPNLLHSLAQFASTRVIRVRNLPMPPEHSWPRRLLDGRAPNELTWDPWCKHSSTRPWGTPLAPRRVNAGRRAHRVRG